MSGRANVTVTGRVPIWKRRAVRSIPGGVALFALGFFLGQALSRATAAPTAPANPAHAVSPSPPLDVSRIGA